MRSDGADFHSHNLASRFESKAQGSRQTVSAEVENFATLGSIVGLSGPLRSVGVCGMLLGLLHRALHREPRALPSSRTCTAASGLYRLLIFQPVKNSPT